MKLRRQRGDLADHQVTVSLLENGFRLSRNRCLGMRFNTQCDRAHARWRLCDRHPHHRLSAELAKIVVLGVAYDTDDCERSILFTRVFDRQAPAETFVPAKPGARQCLVDHSDALRAFTIAIGNPTPAKNLHAHRLEIPRRDVIDSTLGSTIGAVWVYQWKPQILSAEQSEPRHARGANARERVEPLVNRTIQHRASRFLLRRVDASER